MGSSPSIHDMNAESAEHIAVVIQSSILSSQSLFVVNLEDVLQPHFARHRAQVYQLIVATDAARLHSTQECQRALALWVQTTAYLGEQSRLSAEDETQTNRSSAALDEAARPFDARERAGFYYEKCPDFVASGLNGINSPRKTPA